MYLHTEFFGDCARVRRRFRIACDGHFWIWSECEDELGMLLTFYGDEATAALVDYRSQLMRG